VTHTSYLKRALGSGRHVVFEGNQGVLLDEIYGFDPYHTWTDTTATAGLELLNEAGYAGDRTIFGILRAYHTRHGSGPFPTECDEMTHRLSEPDNPKNPWQGAFRTGHFDFLLVEYALRCEPRIDGFALTHMDRFIGEDWTSVEAYQIDAVPSGWLDRLPESPPAQLTQLLKTCMPAHVNRAPVSAMPQRLKDRFGLPTLIESYGQTANEKRFIDFKD
jgi:adenylosuccinate synthase